MNVRSSRYSFLVACLVMLTGVLFSFPNEAHANNPSSALSYCNSLIPQYAAANGSNAANYQCRWQASNGGQYMVYGLYSGNYTPCSGITGNPQDTGCLTSSPYSPACGALPTVSGSIVTPSGDGLPLASSGGCCYMPVNAMGTSNAAGQQLTVGTWEPTGGTCDGTHPGLAKSPSNSPASSSTAASPYSETTNPDGSKTYCDTQNNKCLTVKNAWGPPASSSSSANNSTNWNSTTNNPASSSSTTTTTTTDSTTTGTGSGPASGSSSGSPATWTTTGKQTSKSVTDQPASSSSTSGKCTSAVCDVGEADGQVGQMYTSSGDSVQAEFASFRAQVASTPFAAAVPAFFTFNPSGVCPTWHIPGNAYWGEAGFDFTFFCSPAILAILSAAGWIVLAVGAFSAFRIALY